MAVVAVAKNDWYFFESRAGAMRVMLHFNLETVAVGLYGVKGYRLKNGTAISDETGRDITNGQPR